MTRGAQELWMQITAGQGPVECAWAVLRVLAEIQREAAGALISCKAVDIESGPKPGTAHSALVSISGFEQVETFAASWAGTIQWIARSPFRPDHKRKNWFVGIDILEPVEETHFHPKDVRWETMCASGPGGQHVNRTESVVRVTHMPTGLHAIASEERSQHRNRKLAIARLTRKLEERNAKRHNEASEKRWRAHQDLERGNPVRVFRS